MENITQVPNLQPIQPVEPIKNQNIFKILFFISVFVLIAVIIGAYFVLNNKIAKLSQPLQNNNTNSSSITTTINNKTNISSLNWTNFQKKTFSMNDDLKTICGHGPPECIPATEDDISKIQQFYNFLSSNKLDQAIKSISGIEYRGVNYTLLPAGEISGRVLKNGLLIFYEVPGGMPDANKTEDHFILAYVFAENNNIIVYYQGLKNFFETDDNLKKYSAGLKYINGQISADFDESLILMYQMIEKNIKSLTFDGLFSNKNTQTIYDQIIANDNLR